MENVRDPVLVDERLFCAFAVLNALGFDDEYREEGMHPVRIAVREELGRVPAGLLAGARRYQEEHAEANWFAYTQYSLMLTPPPFSLQPGYEQTGAASVLRGFDSVLESFHRAANLSTIWYRHLPDYQAEADLMRPLVFRCLGNMWDYLRTPEAQRHDSVRVVPNLLNAYHRATVFDDPVTGITYVVSGPYSEQSQIDLTVVHELLHTVLGPAIADNTSLIEETSELMSLVGHLPTVVRHQGDFRTIVEESLIRALTKRIGHRSYGPGEADRHTAGEYSEGFVLIWHFMEQLQLQYESVNEPLVAALPRLLASVDIAREKDRWTVAQGDSSATALS